MLLERRLERPQIEASALLQRTHVAPDNGRIAPGGFEQITLEIRGNLNVH